MKTNRKPSTNKLVARFDNELKIILTNDLKAIKAKTSQFIPSAA
jgi:hypothetical protein